MGSEYDKVMDSQPKALMKERAKVIVEIERSMSDEIEYHRKHPNTGKYRKWFPRWIHALVKVSADDDEEDSDGAILGKPKQSFNSQTVNALDNLKRIQAEMQQRQAEMQQRQAEMQQRQVQHC